MHPHLISQLIADRQADLMASARQQRLARQARAALPGGVYLAAQPEHPYTASLDEPELENAVLDPAAPSQVASTEPGRTQQPVRFTGYQPVSPEAAGLWRATYAYVRDTVRTLPDPAAYPLIAASAARLLVATALSVFPNNALTDPTIKDRHDAHPDTLRRASRSSTSTPTKTSPSPPPSPPSAPSSSPSGGT